MSAKQPTFIVRKNNTSAYFFRSIIPQDLRENFNGIREFRLSLKTGILTEAKRLAQVLKYQLDKVFEDIRCGNNSTTCVSTIKRDLADCLNDPLLYVNKGFGANSISLSGIEPKFGLSPPSSFRSKMKHPVHYKLAQKYIFKLSYSELLDECINLGFEIDEDHFPSGQISRCRRNLLKKLELGELINQFAEMVAEKILNNYLNDLDDKGRKEYLADYPRIYVQVQEFVNDGYDPSVEDIIEVMTTDSDLTYYAEKIGAESLFEKQKRKPRKKQSQSSVEDEDRTDDESDETIEEESESFNKSRSGAKNAKKQPKLSAVIEEYFTEMKLAGVWRPKSELEKRVALGRLVEIIGDISVDKLSHEVARSFKKTLMKLPANMRKNPRYRDKTIKQVVKMKGIKPIAVNTVNNNLSAVGAFNTWARKNGFVRENYFADLKIASKGTAQEERKAFTDKDIKRIFNPEMYLKETTGSQARYWVPLMALFTGARLNELCQLHVRDIKKVDGLWCLDINADSKDNKNPKKLKNKASARVIPIHPVLIENGFIDYTEEQKKLKHKRLFPELKHKIDGYSRKVGQWFNTSYLRKKIGIKDRKKTFHSFRHTVADGLKQKGVAESYICEYLGHSTGKSETSGRYGKRYQPKVLMEEVVQRIEYRLDKKRIKK